MRKHIFSLLPALCLTLGLAAPSLAVETAAAIQLSKTTGAVTVSKSSGKPLTLLDNMRLYNGYHVTTLAKSYAWMNLDDSKLIKEDAASEVEVRKNGKNLEVNVSSGSVFFNVSEKLEDDESLNISVSTMIVGIRGTAGYIQMVDRWTALLTVLEGQVQCLVTDPVTGQIKAETVQAGETVTCLVYPQDKPGDKCDILRGEWTVDNMPSFVLWDVVRDMDLCDRIKADTGVDIPLELAKEAGGDPSGRTPDGKSATPEVLGEVDRWLEQDEDDLQRRQDAVEDEVREQNNNHISPDKVFDGENPVEVDPAEEDTSGSAPAAPATATTVAMPVTADQLQTLLGQYDQVTVQPENAAAAETLALNTPLTVPAGKTLALQDGVNTAVGAGGNLQVNGTLTGQNLTNDGTVTVTSSNTLRLRGNLSGSGALNVTSTGRIVVDGVFSRTGAMTAASGAAVLAKRFAQGAAPSGWAVSDTADADGYYSLVPTEAVTCTVTFDANGGGWADGSTVVEAETDADGAVTFPADPTRTDYTFDGWFILVNGEYSPADETAAFSEDTTVYALWTEETPAPVPVTYTITLDANGGVFADDSSTRKTAVTGAGGRLTDTDFTLTRDPNTDATATYTLTGWSTAADGGTVVDLATAVFEANATLYAQWAMSANSWDWNLSGSETAEPGTLTISGNQAMADYELAGELVGDSEVTDVTTPWNQDKESVQSVVIEKGVTRIGNYAFFGCANLTSVSIPDTVTSIGESAFDGCTSLESVTIPDSVTTIGESAFDGCTSLESVTIPDSVTTIGEGAFAGCNALTSVAIPSSVETIGGYAFSGCEALASVTIPDTVTSIGDFAFSGCSALTSVAIPDGVPSIGIYTFDGCTSLESVTIPDTVTSIGTAAFYDCSALTGITIPNGVETIEYRAFHGCDGLTSITFPSSVGTIGDEAFFTCANLKTVTIEGGNTYIGNMAFDGCDALTDVIANGISVIDYGAFAWCKNLRNVTISDSETGSIRIAERAFEKSASLTLTIPEAVTTLDINSNAFFNSSSCKIVLKGGQTQLEALETNGFVVPSRVTIDTGA